MQNSEQESYAIKVLCLSTCLHPTSDSVQYLQLVFYLLLVNTRDFFPCLTSTTETTTSTPPAEPQGGSQDSDLKLKVREHRRKMGYGLMSTPASQVILEKSKVEGQMDAVRTHLETIVQNALHHMRKDELWKRMLYGVPHTNEGRTVRSACRHGLS